ncbi:MAG: 2Fe-2S iron-sulfur cluster-binding protein [Lysobacter sp.]
MPHIITLQPSGRQFSVAEDETVLSAAKRAGLALAYSCSSAECGSCMARLISGEVRQPVVAQTPNAIVGQRHERILVCKAVPVSDLSLAVRELATPASIPRRELAVTVVDKTLLTPDIMRVRLAPSAGEHLERLPGQYLNVLLPEEKRRAFSIANAPHEGSHIELHIRRIADGSFTRRIFESSPPGAQLLIEGPLGTFVPRENSERPLLFLAGGTGFAPIKALLEHFLHLGSRRQMTLYWGARHPDDLYLHGTLLDWARQHDNLRYVPVLSEADSPIGWRQGLVHQAVIQDGIDLSAQDIYISGPSPMIEACRCSLIAAGAVNERIFHDGTEAMLDVITHAMRERAGIRCPALA